MSDIRERRTSSTRPLLLVTLAGTVLVSTGCAKRVGFWNRDRQHKVEQAAAQADADRAQTLETDFTTTPSFGPSVQEQAMAAGSLSQRPASISVTATPETGAVRVSETTTQFENPTQFDNDPITSSPDPTAVVTDGAFDAQSAPKPVLNATPEPGSVHGGDLSAWVYANAMGIELPTETTEESRRATVNVRRITDSYTGSDFDPIVAPDGDSIIYASTQHSPTSDIYTKPINGAVVTRLTDDPGQDVMPAITGDGSSIAFASDRSGSWDLYMIPAHGGKTLQLTSGPAHDLHPTFSPDGSKVAFCRLGLQSGRWEIWVKEVASDMPGQFIGYGLFPEWCPTPGAGTNGSELILFQRSRQRGDRAFTVWTIEYQPQLGSAGRETEIASGAGQALINPTWSRDGSFICFAAVPYSSAWATAESSRPDQSTIWMVSIDGTNKVKLTDGSSVDLMPAWGHQNNIFFVSNMDGKDHLWTMDLSQAVQTASLRNPSFSSEFANVPTDTE